MSEYVLGSSDHEYQRLELQHDVWREVCDGFHARVGVREGARCLDVGCGPGFTTDAVRALTGPQGRVTALDESQRWIDVVTDRCAKDGWANVEPLLGRIEDVALEEAAYDYIHMRWVLAFLPQPERVVERLAALLRPGGALLVIDYNHEGVSLFPGSTGFDAAIRATRALYRSRGGDTFLMGSIAELYRRAGLETEFLDPRVICGTPGSPAFRWADAFFPFHTSGMVEGGLMSAAERDVFMKDWAARLANPTSQFFSPIVVGACARKPLV